MRSYPIFMIFAFYVAAVVAAAESQSYDEIKATIFGRDELENFEDTKAQIERLYELAKEKNDVETLAKVEPLVDACDISLDKCNQARGEKLMKLLRGNKATSKYLTECIDRQAHLCWTPAVITQVNDTEKWSRWEIAMLMNGIEGRSRGLLTDYGGNTLKVDQMTIRLYGDVLAQYMYNRDRDLWSWRRFSFSFEREVIKPCGGVVARLGGPFEFYLDIGPVLKKTGWFSKSDRYGWIENFRHCKFILSRAEELLELAYESYKHDESKRNREKAEKTSNDVRRSSMGLYAGAIAAIGG